MVIAGFLLQDKLGKAQFFKVTFLLVNITKELILRKFFYILSNVNIYFAKEKLVWKSYTTAKSLSTTTKVKLINWKKFLALAINSTKKIFVIYIAILKISRPALIIIYFLRVVQVASLQTNKASFKKFFWVFGLYLRFLANFTIKLLEYNSQNYYAIKMVKDKQPLYGSI